MTQPTNDREEKYAPDLQLDGLSIHLEGADLEIYANSANIALSEVAVIAEAKQIAALADSRVT